MAIRSPATRTLSLDSLPDWAEEPLSLPWPTVAVDFDGTLARYDGDYTKEPGEPLPGARAFISVLQVVGYSVYILTARDTEKVRGWLTGHDFPQVPVSNVKYPAVAYIDDRAVRFLGDFDLALAELDESPWWRWDTRKDIPEEPDRTPLSNRMELSLRELGLIFDALNHSVDMGSAREAERLLGRIDGEIDRRMKKDKE